MNISEQVRKLTELIKNSKKICVFTGAGISCPSGIPDFRSADGLYNRDSGYTYSPEQMISHTFFVEHTALFYQFYIRSMLYPNAKPNAAHYFFAQLEQRGKDVSIVTQNIDGLHQAAGSKNVIELHGSVHRNYCTKCGKFYSLNQLLEAGEIPRCSCGAVIKPDVVLYEEPLDESVTKDAIKAISAADVLIIVGTSLSVYPAAAYIRYFNGNGVAVINKSSVNVEIPNVTSINDDIINVIGALYKE